MMNHKYANQAPALLPARVFPLLLTVVLTICFLIVFLLSGKGQALSVKVYAAGSSDLLVDGADLLSGKEEKNVLKQLEKVSEKRDCDVTVLTSGNLEGMEAVDYVDNWIDEKGQGGDRSRGTVTLLIFVDQNDPGNREVRVATDEKANRFFSDEDNETLINDMRGQLSEGEYADACLTFADSCDRIFGDSLDEGGQSRGVGAGWLFGDLGIGAAIAFLLGGFQRSKLKTRKRRRGAAEYQADGGIHFSVNTDTFLDRRVERRRIEREEPSESSHQAGTTHTTSSGSKHGGAGAKF